MSMSEDHKVALAEGRKQARAVRAYLEAITPRGGGNRATAETLRARIGRIESRLAGEDDVLHRVELTQARIDAEATIASTPTASEIDDLVRGFVSSAKAYGDRKGIGYAAWREAGVPAAVLKQAGVPETRQRRS